MNDFFVILRVLQDFLVVGGGGGTPRGLNILSNKYFLYLKTHISPMMIRLNTVSN